MVAYFELDRLGLNICIMFYLVDYLSQCLICLIVVFMQNWPVAQLFTCFFVYSFYWVFYFAYMPFESDIDDKIAVFNQGCVLANIYIQFLCTGYVNNDTFRQNVAGNLMMAVFILSILVNVVVGVFKIMRPQILKFKIWRYQRKTKRANINNQENKVQKSTKEKEQNEDQVKV